MYILAAGRQQHTYYCQGLCVYFQAAGSTFTLKNWFLESMSLHTQNCVASTRPGPCQLSPIPHTQFQTLTQSLRAILKDRPSRRDRTCTARNGARFEAYQAPIQQPFKLEQTLVFVMSLTLLSAAQSLSPSSRVGPSLCDPSWLEPAQ